MPDYREIYRSRAADYERLVAREDYQGNILPALQQIRLLHELRAVELGAGTGRLTRLLVPFVKNVYLLDISEHMLQLAARKLSQGGWRNWTPAVADHRALPLTESCADVAIAGWSLGHLVGWHPDSWRQEIGQALAEMQRVLRPGGTIIILETQGTGRVTPRPPTAALTAYYDWLEQECGFHASWIRTDYRFRDIAEGRYLVSFFFGREAVSRLLRPDSVIVPECTGIWSLSI